VQKSATVIYLGRKYQPWKLHCVYMHFPSMYLSDPKT